MLPINWKPLRSEGLILVGPQGDGGYVVTESAIGPVGTLISMGLNDDWRFEADFRRRGGARVICYDHSVTPRFWLRYTLSALKHRRLHQVTRFVDYVRFFGKKEARHERLMVGRDAPGVVSLDTILKTIPVDQQLFLKMDIEGGEYSILDQIVAARLRFTGMTIEFHDLGTRRDEVDGFLQAMTGFSVVALHPNNYYPPDANGDCLLLEVSLTRNDFVRLNPQAIAPTMPPTIPGQPEIALCFG